MVKRSCFGSLESHFETDMGRLEPEPPVEAVGVGTRRVGGQLYPVATQRAGPGDGLAQQGAAHPGSPVIGVHMDRLDFSTESAVRLQEAEDDELADPDDVTTESRHQHDAAADVDVAQRGLVRIEIMGIFRARRPVGDHTEHQQLHNAAELGLVGGADHEAERSHGRPALI
jgi:hypothetical protein